jgi:hypothetical protein
MNQNLNSAFDITADEVQVFLCPKGKTFSKCMNDAGWFRKQQMPQPVQQMPQSVQPVDQGRLQALESAQMAEQLAVAGRNVNQYVIQMSAPSQNQNEMLMQHSKWEQDCGGKSWKSSCEMADSCGCPRPGLVPPLGYSGLFYSNQGSCKSCITSRNDVWGQTGCIGSSGCGAGDPYLFGPLGNLEFTGLGFQ